MADLGKHSPSNRASAFDPARNIRLVPPFQAKEVDKYLAQIFGPKIVGYCYCRVSW